MAYTRKRITRKRPVTRKRTLVRRVPRPVTGVQAVHTFKRMMATPLTFTGNVVYTPLTQSSTFSLSLVANVNDFANLFDQYCITYVVQKFYLKIDPSAQGAAAASYPKFYWYRDQDDSAFAANLTEMRENQKTKVIVMNPNRPVTVAFRPNTLTTMYNDGITSTYQPKFNQWLDMAKTGTTHYGFKWCIDDFTNLNYRLEMETTYYFKCRHTR